MRIKSFAVFVSVLIAVHPALYATLITLEDQGIRGVSRFRDADISHRKLAIETEEGLVYLEGGTVLEKTTFLPVNSTAIYGTANFKQGLSDRLTLRFENNVDNPGAAFRIIFR